MKKIIFLLCLLFFAKAKTHAQPCIGCTVVVPVVDNNFSMWDGNTTTLAETCPNSVPGHTPLISDDYISSWNLPNWKRIVGAPKVVYNAPTSSNLLKLSSITRPDGPDNWCSTTGSQGVAINYPILGGSKYKVTVNIDNWTNNCSIFNNATFKFGFYSGLTEPTPPSFFYSEGTGPSFAWPYDNPFEFTPAPLTSSSGPISLSLCTDMPIGNQIYLGVSQSIQELYDPFSVWAGHPAGFDVSISSVDVQLCNSCFPAYYAVSGPSSPDPNTDPLAMCSGSPCPFSSGGLFVDAAIVINGPMFSNTPGLNTLLWAKWIQVDQPVAGYGFVATVSPGVFFQMLPYPACTDLPHLRMAGTGLPQNLSSVSKDVSRTQRPPATSIDTKSEYSVEKAKPTGISIAPNPATDYVTVRLKCTESGQLNVLIKDVSGRVVHSQRIECVTNQSIENAIDFKLFSPGVYFVDLTLNDQHVVKKVVKI